MGLRGLRDIKTHGSLDREGRLVGVAKNLHRIGSRESENGTISDDWSVKQHVYPKKKPPISRSKATASLNRELFLDNKVRLYQIEVVRDSLQEMRQALAEGIPVATQEFERLTKRLAELEAEQKALKCLKK